MPGCSSIEHTRKQPTTVMCLFSPVPCNMETGTRTFSQTVKTPFFQMPGVLYMGAYMFTK